MLFCFSSVAGFAMKGAAIFPRGGKRTHIEDEDRQEFDLFKVYSNIA